jgi:hypothetical protein
MQGTLTRYLSATGAAWALVVGLFAISPVPAPGQAGFTFGLIGDLAYYDEQEPLFDNVFSDLNRDSALSFIVHVGDLSRPVRACTDGLLNRRLAQFRASAHPFVFTPGDNDWTDCHDEQGVRGGNPLERLGKVRAMFYEGEQSLGQRTMPLVRQSRNPAFAKFRENVRWDMGGVTFVTLHVVGSNNNLARTAEQDAEYAERNRANLAWLTEALAHAKSSNSRAVMILQQANIFLGNPPLAGPIVERDGFKDTREAVEKETIAFGKPVVLVHGDSHFFRIDNPFWKRPPRGSAGEPALENFKRVETFGTPDHHWLHVTAEPNDPNVFTFRPRIVAANVKKRP